MSDGSTPTWVITPRRASEPKMPCAERPTTSSGSGGKASALTASATQTAPILQFDESLEAEDPVAIVGSLTPVAGIVQAVGREFLSNREPAPGPT